MMLAQLLSTMKDDIGKVLIEHFYDGVIPLAARRSRRFGRTLASTIDCVTSSDCARQRAMAAV